MMMYKMDTYELIDIVDISQNIEYVDAGISLEKYVKNLKNTAAYNRILRYDQLMIIMKNLINDFFTRSERPCFECKQFCNQILLSIEEISLISIYINANLPYLSKKLGNDNTNFINVLDYYRNIVISTADVNNNIIDKYLIYKNL